MLSFKQMCQLNAINILYGEYIYIYAIQYITCKRVIKQMESLNRWTKGSLNPYTKNRDNNEDNERNVLRQHTTLLWIH